MTTVDIINYKAMSVILRDVDPRIVLPLFLYNNFYKISFLLSRARFRNSSIGSCNNSNDQPQSQVNDVPTWVHQLVDRTERLEQQQRPSSPMVTSDNTTDPYIMEIGTFTKHGFRDVRCLSSSFARSGLQLLQASST